MRTNWILVCGFFAMVCTVSGTYTYRTVLCQCNGKSRYCLPDAQGLHCVDCQHNTEGRHCERCKEGYYHQREGENCKLCRCNPAGSVDSTCDSRGRCVCKAGATGDKCDRCADGAAPGPDGCDKSSHLSANTMPCFCYGHSTSCSAAQGYSINNISSSFTDGKEGWHVATAQGVTPLQIHFRWSPTHKDVEVIAKDSIPVYLLAPAPYLGNQLMSYGQNLSFSLRLDRGVRSPSVEDVVLEGSGLRVAASLGDLDSVVPCGKRIIYTFRLDEKQGSKWRPHLSPFQFQTLLQNLTAIKIRATFGEKGRGYLDNVAMVSAHRGHGNPATWVQSCSCPQGYEGQLCERCASGYKHRSASEGPFSPCEPCNCRGGSCDPETGDCYSADEACNPGYYSDPRQSQSCVKCPCPNGASCSVDPGTLQVTCDFCPPGTTGFRCHICQEGYYGDPLGEYGPVSPCRSCQCNGHVDPNAVRSCDPSTGQCLRCMNHTSGWNCEDCLDGFYHSQPSEACQPCNCNAQGSVSSRCNAAGQCQCRDGYEGHQCQRSSCPYCFDPIKSKMEGYALKLQELEALFAGSGSGTLPGNHAQMERSLRVAEELVADMQNNVDELTALERSLQDRLAVISQSQLTQDGDIQAIAVQAEDIKRQHKEYQRKAIEVQNLMADVRSKLEYAQSAIRSIEIPLGDAPVSTSDLSSLLKEATDLAEKHTSKAGTIELTANDALKESEKGLGLMRTIMNKENKVKALIGDLKTRYDETSAKVKAMENQAAGLSGQARDESKAADSMLKQLSSLKLPGAMKDQVDAMAARFGSLQEGGEKSILEYQNLQRGIQKDKADVADLMAQGKAAQQVYDKLLARANAAKADAQSAITSMADNMGAVDEALSSLRGFDQQINNNKALADEALKKLPAIGATIQKAVGDNSQTQSLLNVVSQDFNDALGTVGQLEPVVSRLEQTSRSVLPLDDLLRNATRLNNAAQGLKAGMMATKAEVAGELVKAQGWKIAAEEAVNDATGAFNDAKQSRDAVSDTLRNINNLLSLIGEPGTVDEARLKEMEDSLAGARMQITEKLRPRLEDMEKREAAQRTRLEGLKMDIENILLDIDNLKDIQRAVPSGCYNSPPIEHA